MPVSIDGLGRSRRSLLNLLVLHEYKVPDLDKTVAVRVRAAGRSARDFRAVIEENLGAGPARAGFAHGPEIVGGRNADDPVLRQARDFAPKNESFVVFQ